MAVTYKNIDELSPKATLDGNEKFPVSSTQYATAQQIAQLGGAGELIVLHYVMGSETASHFYTVNKEAIDSLVTKCIAGDRPVCGMYVTFGEAFYFMPFNYVWAGEGTSMGSLMFSPGMFVGTGTGFNYGYITGVIMCTDTTNPTTTTSVQEISSFHDYKYPQVDYTSLSEQVVPGEFWLTADGMSKQVYTRTVRGTVSPTYIVTNEMYRISVTDLIPKDSGVLMASIIALQCYIKDSQGINTTEGVSCQNHNHGVQLVLADALSSSRLGQPFSVILKYAK